MFKKTHVIRLDSKDNGKNITTEVGNKVILDLKGNSTTGFTWTLKSYNKELIKFIDIKYKTDDTKLLGAGGTWTSQFKVLKPGNSKIELIYKRPWETKKKPLQNYSVTITTKSSK